MKKQKNDLLTRIFAVIISTLIICVVLASCSSKSNEIINLIDSGQYDEAIDLYEESELGEKEAGKLEDRLIELVDNTLESYTASALDYETAVKILVTICEIGVNDIDEDANDAIIQICESQAETIYESFSGEEIEYDIAIEKIMGIYDLCITEKVIQIQTDIDRLDSVRKTYNSAVEYYENGEYLNAIEMFFIVVESGINSEDAFGYIEKAEAAYVANILSEANSYVKKHDYETAIQVLEDAQDDVYDASAIINEIANVEAAQAAYEQECIKQEAMSTAEALAGWGDYENALITLSTYLSTNNSNDDEVIEIYDTYKNEYVEFISAKVKKLMDEEDYLTAINMLDNVVVSSIEFDNLRTEIEDVKPTYLCELKSMTSRCYEHITDKIAEDTVGNVYDSSNVFNISALTYSEEGYAHYYLGYKYDRLSGVIAVDDDSNQKSKTPQTLIIRGDDKILYSLDMTLLTLPQEIDLDISSVNTLSITMEPNGASWRITAILADFELN